MLKLARTIHFDDSDRNIFSRPAESGEWAISGGFEFSNWTEDDLSGKARQAFANGWLGLESFGRSTFVAVADIAEAEYADAVDRLGVAPLAAGLAVEHSRGSTCEQDREFDGLWSSAGQDAIEAGRGPTPTPPPAWIATAMEQALDKYQAMAIARNAGRDATPAAGQPVR